jgi:nitrate/TMAO reductase-like tetraheme cytochrome c subunit
MGNENTGGTIKQENNFRQFAGSEVCANCHKDIYEKHLHTEHHRSTMPATDTTILGSFSVGKNVFEFDPLTYVAMEKKADGFYQVEYSGGKEIRKEKFDIAVGSGRKGQSYLSWVNNKLVQLPMTYYTALDQWTNSPGYSPRKPMFNRPITSRCLECHSTYFQKLSDSSQRLEDFDRNRIILGIECEKCHGPAADHVAFHQKNKSSEAKFIVNPAKLPRERLMDLCSLCHGGALTKTKPSFQFQAGDTLSNYFSLQTAMLNADNIDVHGNQAGLLYLSKCFTASNLTCINCHNTHEAEQGKLETFSQRCLNCHSEPHGKTCKMTSTLGPSIKQNCIDCHMPKQPSHAIAVYLQGQDVPTVAYLRTHYIKVYPEETKKFLNPSNQTKSNRKKPFATK